MAPKTAQNDPRIELNRFSNNFGLIQISFLWISSFRTFYFWSLSSHILKCPLRPLFSGILLLIIQLSHFKMSAQTPIFGHFTFDHSHILKCPLRPFFSHILLLVIQFSHFKMSAQTPPFGHFTSDHSVLTFRNVDFEWCFMYFQRYKPQPINLKPWPGGMRVSD